jgi:adenylate kinase
MTKIIILSGAPGSGKTTIENLLREKFDHAAFIDLGHLRQFHLDNTWSNATAEEEEMSFENLVSVMQNYIKHEYKYIVVLDLHNDKIKRLDTLFPDITQIFTLIVNDDGELKKRVLNETRDSGFRNVDAALAWNEELKTLSLSENEFKIDNSHNDPSQTAGRICELIESQI